LFGWSNKKFQCHHFLGTFIKFNFFGPNSKIEIRDQFVNFRNFEGSNYNFWKKLRGQFIIFWKFIGAKLKILKKLMTKMQNLKDYNNEEFWNSYLLYVIWNSLNLTWTKYFLNFHHFENSSNYYANNEMKFTSKYLNSLKTFLHSNTLKHTRKVFLSFVNGNTNFTSIFMLNKHFTLKSSIKTSPRGSSQNANQTQLLLSSLLILSSISLVKQLMNMQISFYHMFENIRNSWSKLIKKNAQRRSLNVITWLR